MKREQIIGTIILLFAAFSIVNAQSNYYLVLENSKKTLNQEKHKKRIIPIQDSTIVSASIEDWIKSRRNEGFLTATVDSVKNREDTIYAFITLGEKYKWVNLKKGNVNENLLRQAGFKEKLYFNKSFSLRELNKFQTRLITIAENRGNPFASIKLDSIKLTGSNIQASLNFTPGPPIFFDTLSIVGTAKVKAKFISQYYNIRKGERFSRIKITEAERSISEFSTISAVRPTEIIYSNYKAYPIFFLDHRPANIIDGIIGFLPNQNRNGKLLLTGQLNLSLYNIGGAGRDLSVEWTKLKPLSQLLNLQFKNYNLLQTGVDFETRFNLLKEDTTFINIVGQINLYKSLPHNYGRIKFFTEIKNSRIGGTGLENQRQDSIIADFNLVSYGIGYQWQRLDDVVFPRKGMKFNIEGLIGNKTVRINPDADSAFYRNISNKSIQSTVTASIQTHFKLKGKVGLYAGLSGGILINDQIFINDMFRLGGLKTLRGFNENYFYTSKYSLSNIELRYFYEPESYFMLFYDQAYLASEFVNATKIDYPLGMGGGLNLKTAVGTLQVFYSLGKSKDQRLSFNYSKIHFGIINRF